jgi:hypothetical protein
MLHFLALEGIHDEVLDAGVQASCRGKYHAPKDEGLISININPTGG